MAALYKRTAIKQLDMKSCAHLLKTFQRPRRSSSTTLVEIVNLSIQVKLAWLNFLKITILERSWFYLFSLKKEKAKAGLDWLVLLVTFWFVEAYILSGKVDKKLNHFNLFRIKVTTIQKLSFFCLVVANKCVWIVIYVTSIIEIIHAKNAKRYK